MFGFDIAPFHGEHSAIRLTLAFFHTLLIFVYITRFINLKRPDEFIVLLGLIPVPVYFIIAPTNTIIVTAFYVFWGTVAIGYILQKTGMIKKMNRSK